MLLEVCWQWWMIQSVTQYEKSISVSSNCTHFTVYLPPDTWYANACKHNIRSLIGENIPPTKSNQQGQLEHYTCYQICITRPYFNHLVSTNLKDDVSNWSAHFLEIFTMKLAKCVLCEETAVWMSNFNGGLIITC